MPREIVTFILKNMLKKRNSYFQILGGTLKDFVIKCDCFLLLPENLFETEIPLRVKCKQ